MHFKIKQTQSQSHKANVSASTMLPNWTWSLCPWSCVMNTCCIAKYSYYCHCVFIRAMVTLLLLCDNYKRPTQLQTNNIISSWCVVAIMIVLFCLFVIIVIVIILRHYTLHTCSDSHLYRVQYYIIDIILAWQANTFSPIHNTYKQTFASLNVTSYFVSYNLHCL